MEIMEVVGRDLCVDVGRQKAEGRSFYKTVILKPEIFTMLPVVMNVDRLMGFGA